MISSFSSTWKKTKQSRLGVTGFRRPCPAAPLGLPCASSRRSDHAETRPAFAMAGLRPACGKPSADRQSARFFPTAPPMLGAGQRETKNSETEVKPPSRGLPEASRYAGGGLLVNTSKDTGPGSGRPPPRSGESPARADRGKRSALFGCS